MVNAVRGTIRIDYRNHRYAKFPSLGNRKCFFLHINYEQHVREVLHVPNTAERGLQFGLFTAHSEQLLLGQTLDTAFEFLVNRFQATD